MNDDQYYIISLLLTIMDIKEIKTKNKTTRLLQFFIYFAFGTALPFISIYFKKILVNTDGTPATYWIGLLFIIQSVTGMISPLIAGYIADKFKVENRILTFCAVFVCTSGIILIIPMPAGRCFLISTSYSGIRPFWKNST